MTRRPGFSSVLLSAVATIVQLSAQQPRDTAPSVGPGTGAISGTVAIDGENKPLRGAVVTLNHVDKAYADATITDDRGQFTFQNVPAGRFIVGAEKDAFVPMKAGAARPGRAGIPIALKEGERHTNVRLALPRGAVLTGTVRMPDGDPAAGVPVMVQRVVTTGAERRFIDFPGGATTDDRGVYRVFGLVEGDYIIQAVPDVHAMHSGTAAMLPTSAVDVQWAKAQLAAAVREKPAAPPDRQIVSLAPVYFPGVALRTAATLVSVGRGEVRTGLDIPFQLLRTHRVTGTLLSPAGHSEIAEVFLVEVSGADFGFGMHGSRGPDFSFVGVAPGTYKLVAAMPREKLFAMSDVQVGDHDVRVNLTMQPGLKVPGKVTFAGKSTPPDAKQLRIWLTPMSGGVMLGASSAQLNPDGSFEVEGLMPGLYRLSAGLGGTTPWSLASAIQAGRELSITPVEITAASASEPIAVTFTDRVTELTGRLEDALGRAAADYFILVFSTNERAWYEGSRAIAQTRPGSDGQFIVKALPPGDYFLAAVTDIERDEWFNPALLRELVPAAIRFSVAEGERKVQNIQIK